MRDRLTRVLDDVQGRHLTQVVAPIGAGKTTMVADWADRLDVRWLRADQQDRLLEQVLDGHDLRPQASEAAAVRLLQDLDADVERVVIVLDDAHLLTTATKRRLVQLVVQAPQAAAFLLVGREEVTLSGLPVGLGVSQVTLRGRDLLFSDEEATSLVLTVAGSIGDDELATLVEQGQGWAAALVLGSRLAMTRSLSGSELASETASVMGYLVDETMTTLPAHVEALLLSICSDDVVDAMDAEALSGDADAVRVLETLADDGLLVHRVDSPAVVERRWALHPMVREALRERTRPGGPWHADLLAAHQRAVLALNDERVDSVRVVRHAVRAGDPALLREVLSMHGASLLATDAQDLLGVALAALGGELRGSDPTMLVLQAMLARLTARFEEAARLSAEAERVLATLPAQQRGVHHLDQILIMRLWRARCGWADPRLALAAARKRLGCQHSSPEVMHRLGPQQSQVWSTWLMAEMATVQILTGDLDEAGLHLRELISNGRALGYDQMLAAGMAHRSLLELVEGSFQTAAATARASLEHTAAGDARTLPHVAWAHLVQAWSAVHELDLIAAHQHLAAAEREASTEVDPLLAEMTGLLQAKLLGEEGLVEDARRLLAENRPKARISPPYVRRLVAITTAQTAALVNDVSTVKDQVLALEDLGYPADAQLFAAVALAGEGRLREALADIDGLLGQPRIDQVVAAGAAALRIGVLLRDGDRVRAADLLPDLLNRVAPQRMLQILSIGFVGGKAFGDLLEAESRRAGGHPFADVALTCLGRYATPAPGPGVRRRPLVRVLPAAHTQDPIDRLTPRERDVLVELSYGGSYGDVATALFVSENTVKTHLASVYRKLGVDRRVDALRIARDNDLL